MPSLPGYTLNSGPPVGVEWKAEDAARILSKLLKGLGLEEYIVQGGDVGSWVAALLATTYEGVIGIHRGWDRCCMKLLANLDLVNLLVTVDPVEPEDPDLSETEKKAVEWSKKRFLTPTTRAAIMNSTRPATIGAMLHSSPVALLTW